MPSLHTLRLQRLNLNERGLRELLDNLKFFSELRYFYLNDNPVGDEHTVHSMVKKALPRVRVYCFNFNGERFECMKNFQ